MNCKVCKEEKEKHPIIRNNVTRFIDKDGKMWNGKMCSDCYRSYNRDRMRIKRLSIKIN
jgi:hypothetical protein